MYPKVRFRGFDEPWKTKNVSSTFDIITDYVANGSFESLRKNVVTYKSYNYAYMIRLQDASNNWQGPWLYTDKKGYNFLSKSKLFPGDIVMSNVGSVGLFYLIPDLGKPMTLAPNSILLRSSFENNRFLFSLMNSNLIKTQIEKEKSPGAQPKINKTDFKKIKLVIPQRTEQNVIANLFKVIDSLLSLQQRKLELEKALEKSLFQNLYTDFPNIFPKLAFEKSPWHAIKLQDAFTEISKRSKAGQLLTVSISKGIFPFNESERKNNSSSDKSKYKVVKINDIAYNTMRMWQGAEAVSRYDGIVSPAYTVIRAKKNQNPFFYAFMFKREKYLYLFQTYSQGLTSDTWNLKYPLFKEIKAMIPENLYIQDKIANILNTRLKHTELENTKLETFQALKQFLLQNLFI
ncbi:restriction endonuclease subunit S [Lactobacillus mulieris]|uniref:restriction endonuclease subunit S n=1 Tax=Lactobacillus mulieris TaxID=2508708 RepID=UPI0022CD4C83|nr:restriction endonuclease subunit S [Lactobacillus mulieris]